MERFEATAGGTFRAELGLEFPDGTPVDLTGAVVFSRVVGPGWSTELSVDLSRAAEGRIVLGAEPDQTVRWHTPSRHKPALWDVRITHPDGDVEFLPGEMSFELDVWRPVSHA